MKIPSPYLVCFKLNYENLKRPLQWHRIVYTRKVTCVVGFGTAPLPPHATGAMGGTEAAMDRSTAARTMEDQATEIMRRPTNAGATPIRKAGQFLGVLSHRFRG